METQVFIKNHCQSNSYFSNTLENQLQKPEQQIEETVDQQQFLRIKQMLSKREKQLKEKDHTIKILTQKSRLVDAYEGKIQKLEVKIGKLENLLEKLESQPLQPCSSKSSKHLRHHRTVTIDEEQAIKQEHQKEPVNQTSLKKQAMTQKQLREERYENKQNKKPEIKSKKNFLEIEDKFCIKEVEEENEQKNIKKSQKKLEIKAGNYEEAISSKFLAPEKDEQAKTKELDLKFNKIKENLQNKSKSNKNIQQIYSILSNHSNTHKLGKEQSALKEINERLKNILDESSRIKSNTIRNQSPRQKERFSVRTQYESRVFQKQPKPFNQEFKLKSDSFSFKKTSGSSRGEKSFRESSKVQKSFILNNEHLAYNAISSNSSLNNSFHCKKMNRILNATTVNEILETRKCFDVLTNESGKGFLNKSTDYSMMGSQKQKAYRK